MSARRLILIGCQLVALAAIGGLVTAPTPALAGCDGTADGLGRGDGVSPTHLMLGARSDGRLGRAVEARPPHGVARAVGLLPEPAAAPPRYALGVTSDTVGARAPIARAAVPKSSRGPPGT